MAEYIILLLKMAKDNCINQQVKLNFEQVCDLQIMLRLTCILSFLEFVHVLIEFTQMQNIFVYDLVVAIKVQQGDLYNMCYDQTSKFVVNSLWSFKKRNDFKHDSIHMQWISNVNTRVYHLAFEVYCQHMWAMHWDLETMVVFFCDPRSFCCCSVFGEKPMHMYISIYHFVLHVFQCSNLRGEKKESRF